MNVLDVAETIAVPMEDFVASLLPAWQLALPVHDLLLVGFQLILAIKVGPADITHNDRYSVGSELVLDDQPSSLVGSVAMRA